MWVFCFIYPLESLSSYAYYVVQMLA
uniref:Uncharacterized protein n=1 Tax=Anguilla anguilla TaxID=7936 RepID=A0A0E9XV00_ANGAN